MRHDRSWRIGRVFAGLCALSLVCAPAAVTAEEDEDRAGLGVMLTDRDDTVRVLSVLRDSPAEEAGLKRGDEIRAIDGERVESVRDVQQMLREKSPDDEVEIEYKRNDETETTSLELTERREALRWGGRDARRAEFGERPGMGITIAERNGHLRVRSVERGSPADEAGLRTGDQIRKINGDRVESARDILQKLRDRDPGDEIELTIRRNDETKTVEVELVPRREAFRTALQRRQFREFRERDRDRDFRDRDPRDREMRFRPDQQEMQRQLQQLQRQLSQLQREIQQMRAQQRQPDRFRDDRYRDDRLRDDRFRDDYRRRQNDY